MRTLTNPAKHMNGIAIFRILVEYTMFPARLCSFWINLSGHFARLACNHSYGYAFRPIEQIDSLKFPQNSAFSCNMRASRRDFIRPNRGKAAMLHHNKNNGDKKEERRKHWRDRRVTPDRRNQHRLQLTSYDCRSFISRRQSDVGGELAEGEIWWQQDNNNL